MHPRHATFLGHCGNRLEGDVYGAGGPTALLLHGGGQTRHAWRATARKLAERGYTAVCVDQRGHGDSEWLATKAYTFPDYGRDAIALARAVEARFGAKPVAIGASMGGIASLYALGIEACMSALILVDITPRMEESGVQHVQAFMRSRVREGFGSIEEAADNVAAYLPHRKRPTSLDGLRKNLRQHADGRWYWHWDPGFLDAETNINKGRESIVETLEAAARKLTVPTLLVRGGSSDIVSLHGAKAFLDLCPHAEFIDVSGAGHMVAGDKNDVFADAILAFLKGQTP